MKLFIFILIIAAFLQTSFLPVNLCLLLLICRGFTHEDGLNLVLAFTAGIILGLLEPVNLGFWPLVFLVSLKIIQFVRGLPLTNNLIVLVPVTFLISLILANLEKLIFLKSINLNLLLVQSLLVIPIYFLIKFWEERFVVRQDLKLRLKN